MKASKLRIKSIEELDKMLSDKSIKLSELELEIKTGKEKDYSQLKYLRKDQARILTLLVEKRSKLSDNEALQKRNKELSEEKTKKIIKTAKVK